MNPYEPLLIPFITDITTTGDGRRGSAVCLGTSISTSAPMVNPSSIFLARNFFLLKIHRHNKFNQQQVMAALKGVKLSLRTWNVHMKAKSGSY
jgi:hypothetical protein